MLVTPIFVIFTGLFLAHLLAGLAKKIGMPRAVGQILAGFLLSLPVIKNQFFTPDVTVVFGFISQIGVILLYYFIGLETSLRSFLKHFDKTISISAYTTFVPLILGYILSKYVFGFGTMVSFLIAVVISISSITISLDVLEELKMVKSLIGNLLVSIAAVSNIFEFIFISALLIVFHSATSPASLFTIALDVALFTIVVVLSRLILIPYILKFFEIDRTSTSIFAGSMIIVLMMVYFADLFGMGAFIGALMAGVIVRQIVYVEEKNPKEEHDIANFIHILSFGFFIPIFFVWIGVNTNLMVIFTDASLIFALVIMDMFTTIIGTLIGYMLQGGKFFDGIVVGLGLVPKGEDTGIVIATLALNSKLIDPRIYSAIVLVIFLNTIFAPVLFRKLLFKWKKQHYPASA